MLELPALLWERSKHSGKLCLRKSLIYRRKQQVHNLSLSLARTELCGACVPACVPLSGCCLGDPPVCEVTRINLLFAFHAWFCGCSCVLPVSVHTDSKKPTTIKKTEDDIAFSVLFPAFIFDPFSVLLVLSFLLIWLYYLSWLVQIRYTNMQHQFKI